MLTDSDADRFDSIMERILQRREERESIPDRNEDRIAEILYEAEKAAAEEHTNWIYSVEQFASSIKFQAAASDSDNSKEFPQIDRYRNFTSDGE